MFHLLTVNAEEEKADLGPMIDYKFQAVVTGSALEKDDRMMEVEQYSNDEDEFIYALPFDKKDDD